MYEKPQLVIDPDKFGKHPDEEAYTKAVLVDILHRISPSERDLISIGDIVVTLSGDNAYSGLKVTEINNDGTLSVLRSPQDLTIVRIKKEDLFSYNEFETAMKFAIHAEQNRPSKTEIN